MKCNDSVALRPLTTCSTRTVFHPWSSAWSIHWLSGFLWPLIQLSVTLHQKSGTRQWNISAIMHSLFQCRHFLHQDQASITNESELVWRAHHSIHLNNKTTRFSCLSELSVKEKKKNFCISSISDLSMWLNLVWFCSAQSSSVHNSLFFIYSRNGGQIHAVLSAVTSSFRPAHCSGNVNISSCQMCSHPTMSRQEQNKTEWFHLCSDASELCSFYWCLSQITAETS